MADSNDKHLSKNIIKRYPSDFRRRRRYPATELRQQTKYDRLMKKRQVDLSKEQSRTIQEQSQTLHEIVQGIMSDNPEQQMSSTFDVRKILSREKNPPIDDLIQAGIVPQLVKFLKREEMPELQFEACAALTNIASGTSKQTRTVLKSLDVLESLLSSPHTKVAEQAVLLLGNIAGDGAAFQREVSKSRVLLPLLDLINTTSPISLLTNVAFTFANLCSYKDPRPSILRIKQYLHGLKHLLTYNDKKVLVDTCWALSYISDASTDRIQLVVDAGLVPRLTELLKSDETAIVIPALRCIGNIVTGKMDYRPWRVPDLFPATSYPFYWGNLNRKEAEACLNEKPDGTFLLRAGRLPDMKPDKRGLAWERLAWLYGRTEKRKRISFFVSYKRDNQSHHAKVDHKMQLIYKPGEPIQLKQHFILGCPHSDGFRSTTVCGLMEHYMKHPHDQSLFTIPLHRTFVFPLLQICRSMVCSGMNDEGISYGRGLCMNAVSSCVDLLADHQYIGEDLEWYKRLDILSSP